MTLFKLTKYSTPVCAATLMLASSIVVAQESADSVVTVVKEEAVKISNVDDWDFGTWAVHEGRAKRLSDNTCVFSSTGAYSLTINSQVGGNRQRWQDNELLRQVQQSITCWVVQQWPVLVHGIGTCVLSRLLISVSLIVHLLVSIKMS